LLRQERQSLVKAVSREAWNLIKPFLLVIRKRDVTQRWRKLFLGFSHGCSKLMMVNCGITQSSHVSWHHRATFQKSNEGKLNPKWWQVLCFGQVIEMC